MVSDQIGWNKDAETVLNKSRNKWKYLISGGLDI